MMICPNDPEHHKEFCVAGIERWSWLVDGNGNWLKSIDCCDAQMAEGTEWNCATCGATPLEEST